MEEKKLNTKKHFLDKSFLYFLTENCKKNPEKTALIFHDQKLKTKEINYGELLKQIQNLSGHLNKEYEQGERLLLIYPPGLDFVIAFLSCLYAGIIAVPCYPPMLRNKKHHQSIIQLIKIIQDTKPSAILSNQKIITALKGYRVSQWITNPIKKLWFANSETIPDADLLYSLPTISTEKIKSKHQLTEAVENDIAFLQYTSGSTSDPKGVMVTHANICHNIDAMYNNSDEQIEIDNMVSWLPLYHDMGLMNGLFLPLIIGATSTLMSPLDFIRDPLLWLQLISQRKNVMSGAPNFAFDLCCRALHRQPNQDLDLSGWIICSTGAETVRPDSLNNFIDMFTPYGLDAKILSPCYGLAESTVFVCGHKRGEELKTPTFIHIDNKMQLHSEKENGADSNTRISSNSQRKKLWRPVGLGSAPAGHELRIVNPNDCTALSDGEIGEVWFRGPSVTAGYWQQPERSQETYQATTADGDGPFLRTGDLGIIWDSTLYLYGRIKDIIIINGVSHAAQDIEWAIQESCAFCRPGCIAACSYDDGDSERCVIFFEIRRSSSTGKPQEELSESEMIAQVRGAVSRECRITASIIIACPEKTLDKTTSGKLRHSLILQRWLDNKLPTVFTSDTAR